MKLLLTSGGLENDSIKKALRDLSQKPFTELNVAYIPTAANIEVHDKKWMIHNLVDLENLDFRLIDIVDISALPKKVWLSRLNRANIIMMSGGNIYYLLNWLRKSGLDQELPTLLEDRVYIGISAGSMVVNPYIFPWEEEKKVLVGIGENPTEEGLGLVNFIVEPHINSPYFPTLTFDYVKKEATHTDKPVYAIDDQTAIQVVDGKVTIISEGEWRRFN